MLCYCKKCGRIVQESRNETIQICDYCHNTLDYVPDEYVHEDLKDLIKKDLKEQFINEYIKSSPEFDQYLFEHRDQDMFNKRMSDQAKMAHGKAVLEEQSHKPKCITCGSTNIKKISVTTKAGSVALWGIFSQKVKKQFHCNSCGYEW